MTNEVNTPPTPEEAESKKCFTLCEAAGIEFTNLCKDYSDMGERLKVVGGLIGQMKQKMEHMDYTLSEAFKDLRKMRDERDQLRPDKEQNSDG